MSQINKTLEYRRARWIADDMNLEQLTREAWAQFPTQLDRTVNRRDGAIVAGMRSRDEGTQGFAIHCARYVDRQGVGTIPMAPAPDVDLGERQPEVNENFLNAGFIALIRDNHVICLDCGRNAGALRHYLTELFRKAGMPDATQQFELVRIGNPNRLAVIDRIGVKRVDLRVSIAEATADELLTGVSSGGAWRSFKRGVSDTIRNLTARDADLAQLRTAEKSTITVSIQNGKGELAAVREGLSHLASDIAEDEEADDFVIHLRDGKTTITPTEMSVRKTVKIEAHANSVSVYQTWDAMRQYMAELTESGQLEA